MKRRCLPNEELEKRGCALVNRQAKRLKIEFEKDAGGSLVMFKHTGVVCDTVLIRSKRLGARRDVSCRDDGQEVLVRDECCSSPMMISSFTLASVTCYSRSCVISREWSRG